MPRHRPQNGTGPRATGFGLLDGLLAIALLAASGAAAVFLFAQSSEANRGDVTVQQYDAVRTAVASLYGTDSSRTAAASTQAVAASGLVPGTVSATSILNPYGRAVTITGAGTGGSGYSVDMGQVSAASCIKLVEAMATDSDVTGLSFATGSGSVVYGGAYGQLSVGAIEAQCNTAANQEISATLQGSSTAAITLTGTPTMGPLVIGKTVVTNADISTILTPNPNAIPNDPSTWYLSANVPAPTVSLAASPSDPDAIIGTINNASQVLTTTSSAGASLSAEQMFLMRSTVAADAGKSIESVSINGNAAFEGTCTACSQIADIIATDPVTGDFYRVETVTKPTVASDGVTITGTATSTTGGAKFAPNPGWFSAAGTYLGTTPPAGIGSVNVTVQVETVANNGGTVTTSAPPSFTVQTQ